jgi:hypothetical protein
MEDGSPIMIEYKYDKGTNYFVKKIIKIPISDMNQIIYDLAENMVTLQVLDKGDNYPKIRYQKVDLEELMTQNYLCNLLKTAAVFISYGHYPKIYYSLMIPEGLKKSDVENKANYYEKMLIHVFTYYNYIEIEVLSDLGMPSD